MLSKVLQVLERACGPGQAIASVDVALNLDQVRVTTEDVLPAKLRASGDIPPTGVVVRERQVLRDTPASAAADKNGSEVVSAANTETEHQGGGGARNVQRGPGSIRVYGAPRGVRKGVAPPSVETHEEV